MVAAPVKVLGIIIIIITITVTITVTTTITNTSITIITITITEHWLSRQLDQIRKAFACSTLRISQQWHDEYWQAVLFESVEALRARKKKKERVISNLEYVAKMQSSSDPLYQMAAADVLKTWPKK